MTKVINFYGGPSAGKSTMAAQLFGWMKAQRMNVEYVPEFAKTLTWQGNHLALDDQIYVLGNQHHALYTLQGQVDYIITDSPLLIQLHYVELGFSKFLQTEATKEIFCNMVLELYMQYDNVNFYVKRGDRKFIQAGRNQDEPTAKLYDEQIYGMLCENWVDFKSITTLDDVLNILKLGETIA